MVAEVPMTPTSPDRVTATARRTAGRITSITDAKQTTAIVYDSNSRVTKITYGSGTTTPSAWTVTSYASNLTTITNPLGKTTTYGWKVTGNGTRVIDYVEDPNGNLNTSTYNISGTATVTPSGVRLRSRRGAIPGWNIGSSRKMTS